MRAAPQTQGKRSGSIKDAACDHSMTMGSNRHGGERSVSEGGNGQGHPATVVLGVAAGGLWPGQPGECTSLLFFILYCIFGWVKVVNRGL